MTTTTATGRHLYSPLGDQREHAVPCRGCLAGTFNICGWCDRHCCCENAHEHVTVDMDGELAFAPVPDPATARTDIPAPRGCTR